MECSPFITPKPCRTTIVVRALGSSRALARLRRHMSTACARHGHRWTGRAGALQAVPLARRTAILVAGGSAGGARHLIPQHLGTAGLEQLGWVCRPRDARAAAHMASWATDVERRPVGEFSNLGGPCVLFSPSDGETTELGWVCSGKWTGPTPICLSAATTATNTQKRTRPGSHVQPHELCERPGGREWHAAHTHTQPDRSYHTPVCRHVIREFTRKKIYKMVMHFVACEITPSCDLHEFVVIDQAAPAHADGRIRRSAARGGTV